jgi:hypothetical protein
LLAKLGRELRIKLGVALRTAKDLDYYEKELVTLRMRIEEERKNGSDCLRQLQDVFSETEAMIPDARFRLQRATQELEVALNKASFAGAADESDTSRAEVLLQELRTKQLVR